MNWTIPLSERGSPIDMAVDTEIFPNVNGYAILHQGEVWIPDIRCQTPGAFLRFLRMAESYSPKVVIANVVNGRLRRVLRRRGWTRSQREVDEWRFSTKLK